jgi:hypothetical protein
MKGKSLIWTIIIMLVTGAVAQDEKVKKEKRTDKKSKFNRSVPCRSPHYDIYTGYFRNDILDTSVVENIACDNPKLERYKNN